MLPSGETAVVALAALHLTTAITLFLKQAVINQGLPFSITRNPSPDAYSRLQKYSELIAERLVATCQNEPSQRALQSKPPSGIQSETSIESHKRIQ